MPCSRPSCAGIGAHPTAVHPRAHTSFTRASRLLADSYPRVRSAFSTSFARPHSQPPFLPFPLFQQRPACLAFGKCCCGLAVHVVHRVCGGEWTKAERVLGCCAYCRAGRAGTWRIGSVQGCALSTTQYGIRDGPTAQYCSVMYDPTSQSASV
jgi:hypothetical protein